MSDFGICPQCGEDKVVMMITMTVVMPGKYQHGIRKKNLTEKTTELWGVDWAQMYRHCRNCDWQHRPIYEYGYMNARAMIASQHLKTLLRAYDTGNLEYTEGTFETIRKFLAETEVHYDAKTGRRLDVSGDDE